MAFNLPIDTTVSNFSQQMDLDGVPYNLTFLYNTSSLQWTLSISDIDDVHIVDGLKLVLNSNLFSQYPSIGLPPGELYCIDSTGKELEINRDNLGSVVELIYVTEAEIDTI